MEQAGRYVFTDEALVDHVESAAKALWHITKRVAGILALLTFTYGLLAAEVQLAKIEQATIPANVSAMQMVREHW
jgi:hypothetical protein